VENPSRKWRAIGAHRRANHRFSYPLSSLPFARRCAPRFRQSRAKFSTPRFPFDPLEWQAIGHGHRKCAPEMPFSLLLLTCFL